MTVAKETLILLEVTHRHGNDFSLHRSEAGARNDLYSYVVQWWEEWMGDAPLPNDDEVAIDAYFEAASEQENYYTHRLPVGD